MLEWLRIVMVSAVARVVVLAKKKYPVGEIFAKLNLWDIFGKIEEEGGGEKWSKYGFKGN